MIPYKFSVDGGDAESFDIHIKWTVSNSNDVGVWADMNVKLVHRKGMDWKGEFTRVPFAKAREEVWCLYVPGDGMVVDFSQNQIVDLMKPQDYETLRGYIGLFMTPFERPPERFDYPDMDHKVNPNVHSSFRGRPILVPPRSTVPFDTVLSIPGPGASEGMEDFWGQFGSFFGGKGSPDFDLQVSVIQVAWPFPDKPGPEETGEIIATQRVDDAFEVRLGSEADTEWIERQEWDVDIGI